MYNYIERYFIVIMLFFSTLSLITPSLFTWLRPFLPILLGIIMFGIGATLVPNDVPKIWSKKWSTIAVIFIKYIIMPLIAYTVGILLKLPLPEIIGLVIIGSCPGGTAANVMSYLSKANVALTITLTFGTTIIAPLAIPALIYLFFHKNISVPYFDIIKSMLLIVLFPVVAGISVKKIFSLPSLINILPVVSIMTITLVIACVVALSRQNILSLPISVIGCVTALNLMGYFIGWLLAKLLGFEAPERKSVALEYGMFDTGLGVVIAIGFFSPAAALPGALLSFIQNLTAATIIKFMNRKKQTIIINNSGG